MSRKSLIIAVAAIWLASSLSAVRADMALYDLVSVDWSSAISQYKLWTGDNLAALRKAKAIGDRVNMHKPVDGLAEGDDRDLATINALIYALRPEISAAGSPVLLPFDLKMLVDQVMKANSLKTTGSPASYFGELTSLAFHPGPYGYRAYFRLKKTSTVMISGSSIFYRMDGDPKLPVLQACTAMVAAAKAANADAAAKQEYFEQLAGYEKRIGEVDAEYFGEREAAIPCLFAGALVEIHILCDSIGDPDCKIRNLAQQIISSLAFVGGAPRSRAKPNLNDPIQRIGLEVKGLAADVAASGKKLPHYNPPGDLVSGSGVDGAGGSTDEGVYGPILFPTDISAYAQTVVYRSDEVCLDGDENLGATCRTESGRVITKAPVGEWRDNFCEMRSANKLFTCPHGQGHAGQDIWGANWNESSKVFPLRAVVDGIAFRRFPAQPAVTLSDVNGSNIDYIYRHMRPSELDKTGITAAQPNPVTRGCTLAPVDRLQGLSGKKTSLTDGGRYYEATARHLHFEIRVPTKAGFQNVSPYQTVVAAHRVAVTGVDKSRTMLGPCPKPPPG